MLGVLLESHAARQRRAGGAALSVAAHLAIIGALTATAAHATRRTADIPKPMLLRFAPPPPLMPARVVVDQSRLDVIAPAPSVSNVLNVLPPITVPRTLPPIIQAPAGGFDSIIVGPVSRGARGPLSIIGSGSNANEGNEWRGSEVLMHLLSTNKPRYPESLRFAGIDGRVIVRFTVDTTGRVEMASVMILSSTHDQFTRSVTDALREFRFKPAEAGGRKVPALAEMPFEFQIAR